MDSSANNKVHTDYSLFYDKIDNAIIEFCECNKGIEVNVQNKDGNKKFIDIKLNGKTSRLCITLKKSGLVSYYCQGNESNKPICEKCFEYIRAKTSLPDNFTKSFTLKNCTNEELSEFIEYIKNETKKYLLQELQITTDKISGRYSVSDITGANVFVTLYNNGTILMQSRITPLYMDLITTAMVFLYKDSNSNCVDFCNTINSVNEELSEPIRIIEHNKGDKNIITVLTMTSIQLLNSGLKLDDYSCYTFGALKAVEGIIKIELQNFDERAGDKDHPIGMYFDKDESNNWIISSSTHYFDDKPILKSKIERAYNTYNKRRNILFHTDYQVNTTSTLDYEDAREVIITAIKNISDICNPSNS